MELIAMAALLIQQSADIETTVRFDSHRRGSSFSCVNYTQGPTRGSRGIVLSNKTFLCKRSDSHSWTASQSEIVSGLQDESYRVCVSAGGMQYPRERTGGICIGDL